MAEITPSQYFVNFLERNLVDTVFTVSGGSIHNVLSALDKSNKVKLVPCYNEQGAVYAAEGYARSNGKVGVCLVTSGPGLTNIITGINCCWVDSIPLFVLAGQVVESQKLIHLKNWPRQRGVQESETEGLVKSIVKSYSSIKNPSEFPQILERLWIDATTNRFGPVVLELPVDMSYKKIDQSNIVLEKNKLSKSNCQSKINIDPLISSIRESNLPVFLIGNGIRNSSKTVIENFISFLKSHKFPYLSTWGSKDLIEGMDPSDLYFGSPGIFGGRKANSLIYFSDCLISIGCSLGYTHTGYRVSNINPSAMHIIDIDSSQFCKPELKDAYKYQIAAEECVIEIIEKLKDSEIKTKNTLKKFRNLFNYFDEIDKKSAESSIYLSLIDCFNKLLSNANNPKSYIFCTDMGTSFTATHSFLKCGGSQLFTAAGHAPMGWGLPGAIGAAFGSPDKTVICLSGDGGLLMDIQELMHLSHYDLNIKLIVINNGGYATIMNTT
ncbi:MAG: hypothetical protein CMG00_00260, partial [Candidatus Marinimicrobia bacterium]|nr:hypothetical protein [Candidatus Neomarinimicrobiota bacterium]